MNPLLAKYSRQAITLFIFPASFFFSSCESSLSDVEITDPDVLITQFVAERALLSDGTVLSSLHTTILDKNLASVELKNGQVKVNGQEMSVAKILNISTYHIPSATVNLNTEYDFEVVLGNGKTYTGTVTTQPKTFTSVTVPENSTVDSDLPISWQDIYVHDDLLISVNLITQTGTVAGETFTLTPAQMEEGSFVIPKSTFAAEGVTSAMITLTGAKYGTIDSEFRNGSATISRMRVEKKVMFN